MWNDPAVKCCSTLSLSRALSRARALCSLLVVCDSTKDEWFFVFLNQSVRDRHSHVKTRDYPVHPPPPPWGTRGTPSASPLYPSTVIEQSQGKLNRCKSDPSELY